MKPYYEYNGNKVFHGECLHVLPFIESDTMDAVICDPPYGIAFMGKEWDHGIPGSLHWKEVLRVAKPGAHLLAFGGTRTFHRLTCAIEDAGWEIRDTIMWVYGSGFPKSLNVSKMIDKRSGVKRKVLGVVDSRGSFDGRTRTSSDNNTNWRTVEGRSDARDLTNKEITEAVTKDAKEWDGWGTSLKPAWEPIIVARKPLIGTVVENVLKHRTGALNIDECRIEVIGSELVDKYATLKNVGATQHRQGRFPSNLIHDGSDEVVEVFPESNSSRRSGNPNNPKHGSDHNSTSYMRGDGSESHDYRDSGSASRFFYCAKASPSDRGEGNNHPTVKPRALMCYLCKLVTPPGGTVLDPFMGSGSTLLAAQEEGFKWIGIDKTEKYCEITKLRIKKSEGILAI